MSSSAGDQAPLFALTEEHRAIREAVRALCEAKVAPYAAEVDEQARYPEEAAAALQGADFHAPHVPEEYGGAGADALATVLVIEEIARVDMSASLIPAVNKLGSLPVQLAGSEELKKHYLGALARGEGGFSYCLSEPDAGSDAVAMKTKATRDGDHWVLNGVKRWITNAGVSEYYTVMAVTDPEKRSKGISAFVVEKSDPGVSFGAPEKKLGIKGSPTREVYLDNVRIPAERMIGAEGTGFETAMRTLDHTRVTIAAQAVGVAQGALDYAVSYAQERQQFGRPIGSYQAVSHRCAQMLLEVEGARSATYYAAWAAENEPETLPLAASMAKAYASDAGWRVSAASLQVHGGIGFTWEHDLHLWLKRARADAAAAGDARSHRDLVANLVLAAEPVAV
jgi:alkylation response protein AidB-like acyl-CoA dehydrogenase